MNSFTPFIHGGNATCGLITDNRQVLDGILIQARKDFFAMIDKATPPLKALDRGSERQAQEAIDQAQADVNQAQAAKSAALSSGDFAELTRADQALDKAQSALARASTLKGSLTASLDQQDARNKADHNAASRSARRQLMKDLSAKADTALTDFMAKAGDDLRNLLILHQQTQNLRERIANDSIAESVAANQAAALAAPPYIPPPPEILRPHVEMSEWSEGLGICEDKGCQGHLEMTYTGEKNGTVVKCGRCGKPVPGHPILQTA